MTYCLSRTPAPPLTLACAAGGEHEDMDLVGSCFIDARVQYNMTLDDGGRVRVSPCRKCGLVYFRVLDPKGTHETRWTPRE